MLTFKNIRLMSFDDADTFEDEAKRLISMKCFERIPIVIEVSNRCKRCAGNIRVKHLNNATHINVSYDYYKEFGINRSLGTLRHEFAHLICYIKNGYMGHDYEFKETCASLGGTMCKKMAGFTFSASASEEYIRGSIKGYKYVYSCPNCDNKIERVRKMTDKGKRYICGTCRTSLRLWKEEYIIL